MKDVRSFSTGRLEELAKAKHKPFNNSLLDFSQLKKRELHIDQLGYRQNISVFKILKQQSIPNDPVHHIFPVDLEELRPSRFVKVFRKAHLPALDGKDFLEGIERVEYQRRHPNYQRSVEAYKLKHGAYGNKKIEEDIPKLKKEIQENEELCKYRIEQIKKPENRRLALRLAHVAPPKGDRDHGNYSRTTRTLIRDLTPEKNVVENNLIMI